MLVALLAPRIAQAERDCEMDDAPCGENFTPWSWLPQVAALAGFGPDGRPHTVLGGELAVRHSESEHIPDRAYSLALGAETYQRASFEPYLAVGFDTLSWWCLPCGSGDMYVFGDLHVSAGGGLAWSDARRAVPFGLARVAFGTMFARPHGVYVAFDGERGEVHETRYQLRSQIDIVLETTVAADGAWRFSMGIALDPLRFLPDFVATW